MAVLIYEDGVLTWTDTRDVDGEADYAWFATVDWPNGAVTSL